MSTQSPDPAEAGGWPSSVAAAAALIWPWREALRSESASLAKDSDSAASLRRAGLLQALVGAILALGVGYFGRQILATIIVSISALTLLIAIVSPTGLYAKLRRGLQIFGTWIGRLLTILLLTPLFYGFFALFGGLFRRGRRDRLGRLIDTSAETYWEGRDDLEPSRERFERQF